MKISIPHIHKIEGEAGFWAEVTKTGKVEHLKVETLEGMRQIEGILIGRKFSDVPIVVSRICGICPVVHILNACRAIEKALNIQVPESTALLRKLFLASQIIQSHTLHLFFMSLADFFVPTLCVEDPRYRNVAISGKIENDLDLTKKFPKEAKAALAIRDFSMKLTRAIGGRGVHPVTPAVGGFRKLPEKEKLQELKNECPKLLESAVLVAELFKKLEYPEFERKTNFLSLNSGKDYSFYNVEKVLIGSEKISLGDFYSNKIEEDLKTPPVKRTKFRGSSYMLGAIARAKNNQRFLNPRAKNLFEEFKKERNLAEEKIFSNIFHNIFFQGLEVVHFLEETEKMLKEIEAVELPEFPKEVKIKRGSGLSAMEAPRGTLFTYFEIDDTGRVLNCNIITPTAQFLNNLEEDLKVFLPQILKLPQKEKIKKIRSLIRVYDPCISCATH